MVRGVSSAHFDIYIRSSNRFVDIRPDGNCFWYALSYIVHDGDVDRWRELKDEWLSYAFRVDGNTTKKDFDRLSGCFLEYSLFEDDTGGILEGYELARLLIAMREARAAVYL